MPFYKKVDHEMQLQKSAMFVDGPGVSLDASQHSTYTYPVQGWYWFDTDAEAEAALDWPVEVTDLVAYEKTDRCTRYIDSYFKMFNKLPPLRNTDV